LLKQGLCVKFTELLQRRACVEQTRIEKIRRHSARLGFEFAKAQHLLFDRKLQKLVGKNLQILI